MKLLTIGMVLFAGGCHDKVCPAQPLSGPWQGYDDAIPKGAVVCKVMGNEVDIQYPDKTVHQAYLQTIEGVGQWRASDYEFKANEYADIGFVNFRAKDQARA